MAMLYIKLYDTTVYYYTSLLEVTKAEGAVKCGGQIDFLYSYFASKNGIKVKKNLKIVHL